MRYDLRRIVRRSLRPLFHLPIRGRHRLAMLLCRALANGGADVIRIGSIPFPIDLRHPVYWLMYYGLYEPDHVGEIRRVVKRGDTCIDIGANVGYMTAHMASAVGVQGRVYAFEPSPTCLGILRYLDPVGQVEVVGAAVSEHSGTASFHETDRIVTSGYGYLAVVRGWSNSVEVETPVWSLDDFCAARGIDHIRYLKIDVEGAEALVLRGANRILSERVADFVLTEMSHGESADDRSRDLATHALMTTAGYEISRRSGRDVIWRPGSGLDDAAPRSR